MYVYKDGMSLEEQKNGAYWERNMMVLAFAMFMQDLEKEYPSKIVQGWYYDTDNNWDGWKRVISLFNGQLGFHIPDDFDIGDLKQIEPNWDGHSTEDKWKKVMDWCGIKDSKTGK